MSTSRLRILVALPLLGQPRHSKRIAMLKQAGYTVEAIAFERDYHSGRMPDCSVEKLGKIAHGHYLQRVLKIISAIPAMRRALKRNQIVYAFGTDMALMAHVAGLGLKRSLILEVGDIRKAQIAKGLKGRLVRMLERYVIGARRLLVVTAPGFIDAYYRQWLKTSVSAIVIENKLDFSPDDDVFQNQTQCPSAGLPLVDRPLRIGYFGLLRCDWSWQVLEELALSQQGKIEIVAAGYVMRPIDLAERAAKFENIRYLGEYRSPQDLPNLYGGVDIVWACYPPPGPVNSDWQWAQSICRSNRFYESCFFKKPIISVAGSGDAHEVERYNIGLIVRDQSIKKTAEAICEISCSDLIQWHDNLLKLPKEAYLYTAESDELNNAIKTHC